MKNKKLITLLWITEEIFFNARSIYAKEDMSTSDSFSQEESMSYAQMTNIGCLQKLADEASFSENIASNCNVSSLQVNSDDSTDKLTSAISSLSDTDIVPSSSSTSYTYSQDDEGSNNDRCSLKNKTPIPNLSMIPCPLIPLPRPKIVPFQKNQLSARGLVHASSQRGNGPVRNRSYSHAYSRSDQQIFFEKLAQNVQQNIGRENPSYGTRSQIFNLSENYEESPQDELWEANCHDKRQHGHKIDNQNGLPNYEICTRQYPNVMNISRTRRQSSHDNVSGRSINAVSSYKYNDHYSVDSSKFCRQLHQNALEGVSSTNSCDYEDLSTCGLEYYPNELLDYDGNASVDDHNSPSMRRMFNRPKPREISGQHSVPNFIFNNLYPYGPRKDPSIRKNPSPKKDPSATYNDILSELRQNNEQTSGKTSWYNKGNNSFVNGYIDITTGSLLGFGGNGVISNTIRKYSKEEVEKGDDLGFSHVGLALVLTRKQMQLIIEGSSKGGGLHYSSSHSDERKEHMLKKLYKWGKDNDDELDVFCFESIGKYGVRVVPLRYLVQKGYEKGNIFIRTLREPLSFEQILNILIRDIGKDYNFSIKELVSSTYNKNKKEKNNTKKFCSQLVASIYQEFKIINEDIIPNNVTPAEFGSQCYHDLLKGWAEPEKILKLEVTYGGCCSVA